MYRRRRPQREQIAFGFDSFLDVVANVIGVIIRLILVAWVGARAYHSALAWIAEQPPATELSAPRAEDDPANAEIAKAKEELDAAQQRLLEQLRQLEGLNDQAKERKQMLGQLTGQRRQLAEASQRVEKAPTKAVGLPADLETLRQRTAELIKQVRILEQAPSAKRALRYQVPVSRAVEGDELFFECKAGKVTFIDLPAFLQEIQRGLDDKSEQLKTQWKVTATTPPVGAFRLRYEVERFPDVGDLPGSKPRGGSFRYGVSEWEIEPVFGQRGESADQALRAGSAFRNLVDGLDPSTTVVTLWVYPDSFELFRRLRDHLHAQDLEVAGRPLTPGTPIRASRFGSKSRGQ